MSAYASKLDIYNAALLRLGEPPIQEGDSGGKAMMYRGSMDGIIQANIRRHKFGFCRKQSKMALQGPDERDGLYVYPKPADCILTHRIVFDSGRLLTRYDTRNNKIVSPFEVDQLWMLHTYNAPVEDWSADFAEVIILNVMSVLKGGLFEDHVRATEFKRDKEILILEAIARDKFENPPERWIYEPGLGRHVRTDNRRYSVTGYGRS